MESEKQLPPCALGSGVVDCRDKLHDLRGGGEACTDRRMLM